jgi:hypothetical protein
MQTTVIAPVSTPVTIIAGDQPVTVAAEHRMEQRPFAGPEKRGANSVFDHAARMGVDTAPGHVVESGYGVDDAGTTEPLGEGTMEAQTQSSTPAVNPALTAAGADIAAKQAAKEAATAAKIAAKEKANADRKAAQEAKAAAKQADKDQKAAERAARPPRDPSSPMIALSERVKSGVYVKGVNGQLRSNDEVAIALESVPAKKMVPLLLAVLTPALGLEGNPYGALNYGQQSMNLRNRLRGALKKGVEFGPEGSKQKLTLDYLKQVRDDGGYTTAEAPAQAAPAPVAAPVAPVLSEAAAAPGGAAESAPNEASSTRKGRGRK